MKTRIVSVTEFKAKCLALLDEVATTGDSITVTKRGKPLATVRPAKQRKWKSPEGAWIGKVEIEDDMADFSHLWDAVVAPERLL